MFPIASFPSSVRPSFARRGFAALATLALCGASLAFFSASAHAEAACKGLSLSQPFLKWGDANVYQLVPGGDFEKGLTGWSLTGGAKVVSGSETYGATGSLGKYSLTLPAGATAQTPYVCVEASYPTFRFFARNEGSASSMAVEVRYKNTLLSGGVVSGILTPGASWAPSPEMLTGAVIGGVLSGGSTAQLSVRFRATTGASRIDDVFIDPRMH